MIPTPVMDAVELEVVLLVVVSVVTLLLLRNFRLKREAFDEIDRFMEDNADLMRAGGDEFFERWMVASYVFNSFGVTRSHYARVVEDMKEFIVESAKEETSGPPPPLLPDEHSPEGPGVSQLPREHGTHVQPAASPFCRVVRIAPAGPAAPLLGVCAEAWRVHHGKIQPRRDLARVRGICHREGVRRKYKGFQVDRAIIGA